MYDDLVKRLRSYAKLDREYNGSGKLFDEAADVIEKLSKSRWIPVTERLPEDGIESVLVYANGDGVECLSFITTAYFNRSEWRCGWNNTKISTVTHWMPLPSTEGLAEPPKEENR